MALSSCLRFVTSACRPALALAHGRALLAGALPVFVAAAINGCVHLLICIGAGVDPGLREMKERESTEVIGLTAIYAVLAHLVGYIYIVYLNATYTKAKPKPDGASSDGSSLSGVGGEQRPLVHDFIAEVSSENCGFAWRQTLSLLALYWLDRAGSRDGYWVVLCQWAISVISVVILVIVLFYLRKRLLLDRRSRRICCKEVTNSALVKRSIQDELLMFDSEAFALALASSFTIILVVYIYPAKDSDYFTSNDDGGSNTGSSGSSGTDPRKSDHSLDGLFVLYAIGLTALLTLAQIYGNRYYYYHHYLVRFLKRLHIHSLFTSTSTSTSDSESRGRYNSINTGGVQLIDHFDDPLLDEDDDFVAAYVPGGTSKMPGGGIVSIADKANFEKKAREAEANSLYQAMCRLGLASSAYLVVCAWYSWSVLSFQSYFDVVRNGSCLGLFSFAVMVTLLMLLLLMVFTKSPKGSELQSDPEMASHDAALESLGLPRTHQADYIMEGDLAVEDELKADPEERIQWLLLTGRFIVGWAWSNFASAALSTLLTTIIPGEESSARAAIVRLVVASAVGGLTIVISKRDSNNNSSSSHNGTSLDSIDETVIRFR